MSLGASHVLLMSCHMSHVTCQVMLYAEHWLGMLNKLIDKCTNTPSQAAHVSKKVKLSNIIMILIIIILIIIILIRKALGGRRVYTSLTFLRKFKNIPKSVDFNTLIQLMHLKKEILNLHWFLKLCFIVITHRPWKFS